jgi:hypothetical protein
MIRLPQSVLVWGDGSEAAAIRTLFGLFVPQSFHYRLNTPERNVMDGLPAYEDGLVALVSTEQGEMSVSNLIHRLALLRFQAQWPGPILIVANPSDVQQLQKWELFKLQHGAPYVAQTCVCRPVLVRELFSALSTLRDYQPGAWKLTIDTLKGQDAIQRAWDLLRKIEGKVSNGERPINLLEYIQERLGIRERCGIRVEERASGPYQPT